MKKTFLRRLYYFFIAISLFLFVTNCKPKAYGGVVYLHNYMGMSRQFFQPATILERREGYVRFQWDNHIIEYSGEYTILSPNN